MSDRHSSTPSLTDVCQKSLPSAEVQRTVDGYIGLHDEASGGNLQARKSSYTKMANDFYDLVTDFYEYGWGQSFHFAPRFQGETFRESILRYEYYIALRLGLRPGMEALDVGCGVGGPMKGIARFSGASVTGVNNNAYQIQRGTKHIAAAGLEKQCRFLKADFMKMPVEEARYDAVYSIEATPHAPDKVGIYKEILRVLKPGGLFAAYEWCLTAKYEAKNPDHRAIKKGIEEGDALPDIPYTHEVIAALQKAGFEVLDSHDHAETGDVPWQEPLAPRGFSLAGFRSSGFGRWFTNVALGILESVRIVPKGSKAVSTFLNRAAVALVAGGKTGTFTPMFFILARRPSNSKTKLASS